MRLGCLSASVEQYSRAALQHVNGRRLSGRPRKPSNVCNVCGTSSGGLPHLFELDALCGEHIYDQVRHDVGQTNCGLLGSCEPGDAPPSTSGRPRAVLTCWSAPDAWQTKATGLSAARKESISLIEVGSLVRSYKGPWPLGVENGVEVLLPDRVEPRCLGELSYGVGVGLEAAGFFRL